MLAVTALTWILLFACTLCWPAAALVVYIVWRSAKRHDEMEARERAERAAAGHDGPSYSNQP